MLSVLRKFFLVYRQARETRRSSTVKHLFTLLVGFVTLLSASALSSQEASYISLQSDKSVVMEGEEFSVAIYAYAHVPVNAVELMLRFPPEFIDIVGVDTGRSVITIWTEEPKADNNTVRLSGGTYRRGFVGEHLIAEVTVRAKKTGQTSFSAENIALLAGDGSGSAVRVLPKNANKISFHVVDQSKDSNVIGASLVGTIREDIDGDGQVNLRDVSLFMAAWFARDVLYDFNQDNRMNIVDFSIILARTIQRS